MSIKGIDITVLGGGIAGLASATALAQRGAVVTVLEAATELGEVGAGLQIGPNGVAVLEALGLREAAAAVANVPEAVELRDMATGREVARLPMGQAAVQRWGRPYWQFHRADLLGVLADGARAAGVDIRLGQQVGSVKEIEASVVIAADGVRSAVRAEVFDGQPASFTGQVAWRGIIPAEKLPAEAVKNAATVYMGPGRHLVTYPMRGGSVVNFVAVEGRDSWASEGWNIPDTPENLRRAFASAGRDVQTILNAVDETFLWGLFNHPYLPHWTKDNIALVGDACHPMLPYLAQGAVMALEDAWVLARELDRSGVDGLQAYERICKPRATRVQKAAASNATAYHLPSGPSRLVAHAGLKAISRLAPSALLGRFDWLYGADVTKSDV
ncbi:MAG: FAD-dependent monooxygenase [Alphaproteobacteria bacterium]